MRPIPAEILKRYPIPCDVPGRPWWRRIGNCEKGAEWERRGPMYTTPGHAVVLSARQDGAEQCAAIDTEHPIPHPGYRLGQIWATQWHGGSINVVHATNAGVLYAIERDAMIWLLSDPVCPHLAPWGAPAPDARGK